MITVTVLEYTAAVNVQDQTATVSAGAEIITRNPEEYTGETEVTPDFEEHILPTRNKTMLTNVTVHAIPVNQAINESDGYTVWIGGI